tara:strand:+ start:1580 stop:3460 length:1881 start_codon:yes stop_codon:yes gene_type:complete
MIIKKNYILFLIPLVLFLSKWTLSFIIFPDDFLITKILVDTPDSQYYPIITSLANFDFSPSYHDNIDAENLLAFPYGPIILHALFYKIFGSISIILSEFIFILLFFIVIFKIFKHIGFSFSSAIFSALLILFIPTLFDLLSSFSIPYILELKTANTYIFSTRFPRPQVTSFYYLAFIYLSLRFADNIESNSNKKYAIYFAIILGLIVNSFFYFFIYCLLSLFILLTITYKKKFFLYIKLKINFLLTFVGFFSIFLFPFFLQIYLGEEDHSARIGLINIDLTDKIYLIKFFFKSILRLEPILIFITSILLTFIVLKKFNKEKLFNKICIFFYLYIAAIITPFLFIIFSPKVIAIYHFADYILVNGLLYIIISLTSIFYFYFKEFKEFKFLKNSNYIKILLFLIILILFSLQNYNVLKAVNVSKNWNKYREPLNKFNQILVDNNITDSKVNLFTNDYIFANAWIFNNNSNLIISDGFTNAIKDENIIKNLIKGLKLMGVNSSEFREIINFKGKTHYGRNPLTTRLFNYKYQANKFRKYSNEDQYTESQNDLIKRISPLRVMINIVPIDQKKILFRKFDLEENFKNDYGNFIAVINTDLISDFFMDKNYEDFNILYKKDNILILRKILN